LLKFLTINHVTGGWFLQL